MPARNHRDGDGPTVIKSDTVIAQEGENPAIIGLIDEFGNTIFKDSDGKLHREDGPAFIDEFGNTIFKDSDGKLHREDGPAFIGYSETQEWWINGQRVR